VNAFSGVSEAAKQRLWPRGCMLATFANSMWILGQRIILQILRGTVKQPAHVKKACGMYKVLLLSPGLIPRFLICWQTYYLNILRGSR
jgi:hypothetical protein